MQKKKLDLQIEWEKFTLEEGFLAGCEWKPLVSLHYHNGHLLSLIFLSKLLPCRK